ncbi:MAG TPA: FG-GAP-like repeat-containing protein [Pyrinomonadaceae bacterium]
MTHRFFSPILAILLIFAHQSYAAPFTGELDRAFNPTVGRIDTVRVRAIAAQPDGKFIAAGAFLKVNGTAVNSVARFNADGALDPTFDAAGTVFGSVSVLALQPDGKVIVGGNFDTVGRQIRRRLARLNADGSFDPTFVPPVQAAAGGVVAIAVQPDGKILVYGASLFAGRDFARLNADGSLDTSFATNSTPINTIAVQPDGKILIGFAGATTIGGQTRKGAARLNADGSLDASFPDLNASSTVFKIVALPNGKIMLGGLFSTLSGQQYQRLARLNSNGTIDASFANNPNRFVSVREIAVQSDGKVVYSGVDSPVYRDNADGTPDANFATRSRIVDDALVVAALSDDRIVVGGRMVVYNSTPPTLNDTRDQPLALLAADGTLDEAVNHDIAYSEGVTTVDILALPDGKILFAEDFEQTMRPPFRHITRFNANGSIDPSFTFPAISSDILGTGAQVAQIARQSDGKIIFGTISNSSNRDVFRLNADGSFDSSFVVTNGGASGDIYRIEVLPDDDVLITGAFTQINGQPRPNFARLNADGALDSFAPNWTDEQGNPALAYGFAVQPGGKFYVWGNFTTVNGHATRHIARFNTDGSVDPSFTSTLTLFSNQFSLLAAQPDGKLLLGSIGSLLRLNQNGSIDEGFTRVSFRAGQATSTPIQAAVLPNGKILVGGSFTSTSDFTPRSGFARLNADGTLDTTYGASGGATGSNNTVYKIELQPDGKALIGGRFAYVNNISQFTFARLNVSAASGSIASDFDGDGRTDAAVFRAGTWLVKPSGAPNGFYGIEFGQTGDALAPADYDGDGKTDFAVWRESEQKFYILNSADNSVRVEAFGLAGDVVTVGDWDGDGKADLSVYRDGPQSYFFYRGTLNNPNGNITYLPWGTTGDKPLIGDFDGDRKTDAAVYRGSDYTWYILQSSNGQPLYRYFGLPTDKRVSGDFDGDGRTDVCVVRDGLWYILQSSNNQVRYEYWGYSTDAIAAGDYDGDGKTDVAVWRDGIYYILNSANGAVSYRYFGANGDAPVAEAFVR